MSLCAGACESADTPMGEAPSGVNVAPDGSVSLDASQPPAVEDAGPRDAALALDAGRNGSQDAAPWALDAGTRADAAVSVEAGARDASSEDASVDAPSDAAQDASAQDASADDARCQVAVYDPQKPPRALNLSGNLGTHDPALIEQDGTFYLWHTGPRLPGKRTSDLMRWDAAPAAFEDRNPAWIAREVPGASDLWAPDVSRFGGQYHLYYSASTFGSNASCIGHATRSTLAEGTWNDQGSVLCSNHGTKDDFNAIDPNVVVDAAGTPWLFFGSFWSGIKAVELDASGKRKGNAIHAVASRGGGAIEGPFVVRRCGYYYLFVSFDKCCSGVDSTYNIRVGRSEQVLGPYVDRDGKAMLEGGGTLVLAGKGRYHGPGHNAVIFSGDRAYNVYHAYDGENGGNPVLRVAELVWDTEGWPRSGGP